MYMKLLRLQSRSIHGIRNVQTEVKSAVCDESHDIILHFKGQ